MNDQQPQPPQQQPGWGGPQQPYGQPPYGQQPYGAPPFQPQPPKKKTSVGKIIGIGCGGIVGLFVVIGIAAAAIGGSSSDDSSGSTDPKATTSTKETKAAAGTGKSDDKKADTKKADTKKSGNTVVFKVWGTAAKGVLGDLDITYGSDSDTRKGTFKDGKFEATLPLKDDAMYFNVMAQLQGSGDINCSVTVDGKTKKGHASGGYNICNAQLSSNFTGGWE
ncbi:hypothetical protein ACIPSJ_01585 [Streptomyces sp. NPDC090088]|uniref:hypothetical protein n=1 Tax=Streptomyces sp. NPDC090088 TaxID=3365944 RepID=UPI00381AEAB7